MPMFAPDARILLTGPTGFLGRHVIEQLRASRAEIHSACRNPPAGNGRVVWHAANLLDAAACRTLVESIGPTHLIHAAWMATPGKFWTSPENADWLAAGLALLRAFGEAGGKRFVGVGTCAEYDWSGEVFAEDRTPALPSTPYGKAKAAMAAASEAFAARYGFSSVWGRVFLPYGPGDAGERLVPSVLAALLRGEAVKLGDGTQVRDFIYAPDAAGLILTLAASDATGTFNIGTGVGTSVREAAEQVAALVGRPDLLRFGALPNRAGEPQRLVADMAKTTRILGWKPRHSLGEGLEKTVAAFRA
jgi:nucleoside-diphosphate-sugar epimerase